MFEFAQDNSAMIAFVAFVIDGVLQIGQILRARSSAGVSIVGLVVRLLLAGVFLGIYATDDTYSAQTAIGQAVLVVLTIAYVGVALRYRQPRA